MEMLIIGVNHKDQLGLLFGEWDRGVVGISGGFP